MALIVLSISISIITTRIGLASQKRAKIVAERVRARSQSVTEGLAELSTSRRPSQRASHSERSSRRVSHDDAAAGAAVTVVTDINPADGATSEEVLVKSATSGVPA